MLELPEALHLSEQLRENLVGAVVRRVLPPSKAHKFCWFSGDPADYDDRLSGCAISGAEGFGIFAELRFENGLSLSLNDGVNLRLTPPCKPPKDYQLTIELTDGRALVFTVAMYGGIVLHDGGYDNDYYLSSRRALSPFSEGFAGRFYETLAACKPSLSAKAFLAAEQRFPGIGNGVLQDILFDAGVNPKRKLATLDSVARERLLASAVSALREMVRLGGRDTEKDLFGAPGGYRTRMSKNSLASGCPRCGGAIAKEAYMGGSVYYCPVCQSL